MSTGPALNHLADRPSERDGVRPADRRYLEVLHEESVADGPPKLIEKGGLVDVVSVEDDRAAPDLITEIDAKRTR